MSERTEKLKESIFKDRQRIARIQDSIKAKEEKIKELENTELMNNLNSITARGFAVNDIVEAIKNKDIPVLMGLMEENKELSTEKSGTSSAFQIIKEENCNE